MCVPSGGERNLPTTGQASCGAAIAAPQDCELGHLLRPAERYPGFRKWPLVV